MLKRKLSLQGNLDSQFVTAVEFDVTAGGQGQFTVAPKVTILGPLNAAVSVGLGAVVRCYNTDAVTHYVAIGAAAMAAPSGLADGIAISPNQDVVINTADVGDYIRSDDAKVGGYLIVRDSVLVNVPDANS